MLLRRPLRHCDERVDARFHVHIPLKCHDVAVVGGAGTEGEDGWRMHGAGGAVGEYKGGSGVEGGCQFGGCGEGGEGNGFGGVGWIGNGEVFAVGGWWWGHGVGVTWVLMRRKRSNADIVQVGSKCVVTRPLEVVVAIGLIGSQS